MRRLISTSLLALALLVVSDASAQQAPVPDPMPNDIPYGAAITASRAEQLVAAVMEEARRGERNWKLAIAVVDPHGELVYFWRMDQTQFGSIDIAVGKARTAARLRRPTQVFFDMMQTPAGSYAPTLDPGLIASPGGIPLVENGQLIGAIGCSGASGAQDHVACTAAANAVK